MKNKKFTIGLTLLMAGTLVLTNCTKGKMNEAPSPDYEFKSTQDMNRMTMIIADIDEIGATAANQYTNLFGWQSYTPLSIMQGTNTINSTAGVIAADNTPGVGGYTVTFNNTVGKDGHVRNGVLMFNYGATTTLVGVDYGRQPAFCAAVTAVGYTVDDYTVTINSMKVTNTTPVGFPSTTPYTPANYNLTWSIASDIKVTHAAEISTFNGTINKTLLNTKIGTQVPMPIASPQTFTAYPATGTSLNLPKAWYSYSGTGQGSLPDVGPYGVTITNLTRNFNSSPETFYSSAGMFVTPERHPFLSGTMTFKPGAKPTRDVDYGAGENCDYNAKVTISGITYDVDCKD
jgi:hypothetical protein